MAVSSSASVLRQGPTATLGDDDIASPRDSSPAADVDPDAVTEHATTRSSRLVDALLLVAPLALFGLLIAFVLVDPATRVTASNAPATDEAWDIVNARNFVLLGRFSTDDWNLHLVNVPFSLIQAALFSVAGVGMAQARLVSIAAVALTMAALAWGLRRPLGSSAGLLAALAYGTSTLVLYYGRLAFLEPTVALGLTVGGIAALRAHDRRSGRWGILAGVALALAIGTKPSAAFATAGILVGLAAVGGRSGAVRRWLGGAALVIALAGIAWAAVIGLPNQAAIATDLRIWPAEPIVAPVLVMLRRILAFPIHNDRFVLLSAPVILFGTIGWIAAIRARRSLPGPSIALLAVATGWLVGGFGLLALAPYRPNRYEVPLLPALAILGAIGWSVLAPRFRRIAPARAAIARLAVAGVLVLPGLVLYATWMGTARSGLPDIQATVRAIVPAGAAVQGDDAPAFALLAPVVTLVSHERTRVNPGDLYVSRGVRWYVGVRGTAPAWAALHRLEWSARVSRFCASWGGHEDCLWQVP
ncbi:MAG TPA: glycosyltransferase family 39 protein [Candidatus Limnocylindrales bacterium]